MGDAAHLRTVTGTAEGATFRDEGKTIEIVSTGDHGWTRDFARRLGYPALGGAALFLTDAIFAATRLTGPTSGQESLAHHLQALLAAEALVAGAPPPPSTEVLRDGGSALALRELWA